MTEKKGEKEHDLEADQCNFSISGHEIAKNASVFSIGLICNSRT